MIERDRINILMARKVSGEATAAELEELDILLMQFPEQHYAFNIVTDIDTVQDSNGFSAEEENRLHSEGWQRMEQLMQQPAAPTVVKRVVPWRMIIGVAACIAVLVTVYSVLQQPGKVTYRNEVVTKTGSKTSMVLPDGSTVVLNACSRLQYDASRFLEGERAVTLAGEGYFDIKHDPAHPFTIQTGDVNIKVLGTVFNVKAYAEDAIVETTLLSGKVEVSFPEKGNNHKMRVIQLKPEQKLTIALNNEKPVSINKKLADYVVTPVKNIAGENPAEAAKPETAWIKDRFEFDNITFEQLSHDLERWFDVTVTFRNNKYKREVFTGAFKKQGLDEVLRALQLMSGFHYEVNEKENAVYIW
ncbi:MAG TPA: FecR domain-containing protein [Chitinophaga sp.]|uniref:FecR family protein n=1 Tax=Chitinophaga sp. TaxID=1869181 RepID=UPI002B86245B|nr:FecR domain-containing protein [Chitinophaga sp.]HVI48947.1 FecR domain-containing protein [Chitinophaga sp.]